MFYNKNLSCVYLYQILIKIGSMEDKILVTSHLGNNKYKTVLSNGRTEIIADEPIAKGGSDLGPAPRELLCMSLAACTSITLRMYSDQKKWEIGEIDVDVELESTETETIFHRKIRFGSSITEEMKNRLLLVADKCPVHKIFSKGIKINTELIMNT